MALNNRGLGRGLQALFDGNNVPGDGEAGEAVGIPVRMVPPDAIIANPGQPRTTFNEDSLKELAASIREHGILQPLLARPGCEPGQYQLIAGERRLRAARIAGLNEVPVLVREMDDRQAMIITLLENLQREDLNPIEEARGLEALQLAMRTTLEGLADTLGQPRSTIASAIRLLKLDPATQQAVAEGQLTASHAKILVALPGGEVVQSLRQRIIEQGMTTRDANEAVEFWHQNNRFPWEDVINPTTAPSIKKRPRKPQDESMRSLAEAIGARLHCSTKINGTQEKGKISITYSSQEELTQFLENLEICHPLTGMTIFTPFKKDNNQ